MKKLLAIALAAVGVGSANADSAKVFCGKRDGSNWFWLMNDSGNHVRINGEWREDRLINNTAHRYFSVFQTNYNLLNLACKLELSEEYVAQPAEDGSGNWYRFQVNKPNGEQYFAPGWYRVGVTNNSSHFLRAL